MIRWLLPLLGVMAVLPGYGQVESVDEVDDSGFRIREVVCSVDGDDGQRLRCVAEVERLGVPAGMVVAAWGIDGAYVATDQIPGSIATWVLDDPPPGSHTINLVVVDPDTGSTSEAAVVVDFGSETWPLYVWLAIAAVTTAAAGAVAAVLLRRRSSQPRCSSCSTALRSEDLFCPSCGAPSGVARSVTCATCGRTCDPSDRFCPACGGSLHA